MSIVRTVVLLPIVALVLLGAGVAEAVDSDSSHPPDSGQVEGREFEAEPVQFVLYEDGRISYDPADVESVEAAASLAASNPEATPNALGIPNACAFGVHNPHYSTDKNTGNAIVNSKTTMRCTGRYRIQVIMRFQVYADRWYSHSDNVHRAFTTTPGKKHVFYNSLNCPVRGTYRNQSTGYVRWPSGQWGSATANSGTFGANCW